MGRRLAFLVPPPLQWFGMGWGVGWRAWRGVGGVGAATGEIDEGNIIYKSYIIHNS